MGSNSKDSDVTKPKPKFNLYYGNWANMRVLAPKQTVEQKQLQTKIKRKLKKSNGRDIPLSAVNAINSEQTNQQIIPNQNSPIVNTVDPSLRIQRPLSAVDAINSEQSNQQIISDQNSPVVNTVDPSLCIQRPLSAQLTDPIPQNRYMPFSVASWNSKQWMTFERFHDVHEASNEAASSNNDCNQINPATSYSQYLIDSSNFDESKVFQGLVGFKDEESMETNTSDEPSPIVSPVVPSLDIEMTQRAVNEFNIVEGNHFNEASHTNSFSSCSADSSNINESKILAALEILNDLDL